MTESEKSAELIAGIMTWMREPDWIESASPEWLMDWIGRRPLAKMGLLACLVPAKPQDEAK